MSDLTPDLIALPGSTSPEDYYRDAVAAIREGAKRWKDAKANFRAEVGRFFYAAALNLDDKRYKELVKVAVEAFDIGSDSIARYRLEWQRSKSLPAPTPKSASQQRRSIEGATSARPRAGSETSGDRPPERGPGAGGGSAASSSSGRTQDPAEPEPTPSPLGDVPRSGSAAPSPETTDESGDEGDPPPFTSAPKPAVSGSSRPVGPGRSALPEDRPTGTFPASLADCAATPEREWQNADDLQLRLVVKKGAAEIARRDALNTPRNGSLHRDQVEPMFTKKGK